MHWTTWAKLTLLQIAEVKNYFANHQQQYQDQLRRVQSLNEDSSSDLFLFKAPRLNDRSEAMAPFPTKMECDRLVGRYFNSYDPSVHIIHGPTFQKKYDRHWQDPNSTPLVFIGMLYAIMALALQSYHRANDEPPEYAGKSLQFSVAFRRLTAQTLALADIREPIPEMLEALVLHLQAEYGRSKDAESGVLYLVSLVVRIAMRMGYNRDPAPYPNVKPFQAEMRRRVWTTIRQADLMFSFQFGLPAVARADCIDTEIPRNLYDDELFEDMTSLPPSRPDTEVTPMSYMIAKARMSYKFGEIVDRILSITNPPSYEEISELDRQLRHERSMIPPHLQLRPFHDTNDPANCILQRFGLELLYLKSQCVLHRRYIARGRESQRFAYSRRTCIDASMDMLAHQATLHHESQPNGRLSSVKWYISSLTTHDFLLAAMTVCLDLYHCCEAERQGRKSPATSSPLATDVWAADRKEQMMNALRHCVGIWESQRDQSMEAYKASSMLKVMVEKLMACQARSSSNENTYNAYTDPGAQQQAAPLRKPVFGVFPNGQVNMGEDLAPEQSAAMTLGLLSSGGVSPNPFHSGTTPPVSSAQDTSGRPYPASMAGILNEQQSTGMTPPAGAANAPSPFSSLFANGGMENLNDLDWNAWDNFVQGANVDPIHGFPGMDLGGMGMGGFNMGMNVMGGNLGVVDPALSGQGGGHKSEYGNVNPVANGNMNGQLPAGVFMGAGTPGGNGMM